MPLPEVHFGPPEVESENWRDVEDTDTLDDDEVQLETDPSVVSILGFDPLEEGE